MKTTYTTYGTCARFIDIEVEDNIIKEVRFIGGCPGNANGMAALLQGMHIDEVIPRIRGIQCRSNTSCPDQLAKALENLRIKQVS